MSAVGISASRVRIDVNKVTHLLVVERRFWTRTRSKFMRRLAQKGLAILKEEVPKGATGRLEASCWAEYDENSARVGTNVPYDKFIDGEGRIPPSKGRYVKAIDRRLVKERVSPEYAVKHKAARLHISGRLPKGLKIKFSPKESGFTYRGYRQTVGTFTARRDPKTGKRITEIIVFTGRKSKKEIERILAHELWHAAQYATGLPMSEKQATSIESTLTRDIGMHPGFEQVPFSKRTAERMVKIVEDWMRDAVGGAPS